MNICSQCGATFLLEQVQEITLDLNDEKLWICLDCAKRALLIAGQVKVPGWIALVEQPRNLSQLVLRRGYRLSQEQVAELCESGHDACLCRLNDAYCDWWKDFGLDDWLRDWLKDLEIIESGKVKKSP